MTVINSAFSNARAYRHVWQTSPPRPALLHQDDQRDNRYNHHRRFITIATQTYCQIATAIGPIVLPGRIQDKGNSKTSHITTGIERMIFTRTVLNSGLPSAFLRFAGVRVGRTSSLNSRTTILQPFSAVQALPPPGTPLNIMVCESFCATASGILGTNRLHSAARIRWVNGHKILSGRINNWLSLSGKLT